MNASIQWNGRFHVLKYDGTRLVDGYAFYSQPMARKYVEECQGEDRKARRHSLRLGKTLPTFRYIVEPCNGIEFCTPCWDLDNRASHRAKLKKVESL